ncbi:MAG TPA: hypothetical protein VLA09_01545, partial [Longimicrobiales bacterium]|nr:hypothetical protein [Longimicrobiales bacterium]
PTGHHVACGEAVEVCVGGDLKGTDFDTHQDLSGQLLGEWRAFTKEFIPVSLKVWPDKRKVAAGLA